MKTLNALKYLSVLLIDRSVSTEALAQKGANRINVDTELMLTVKFVQT